MKKLVEQCTPYRPYTMGEILKKEKNETLMTKFPKEESSTVEQMMKDARTFLGYHYNHVTFHGIRYGRGMKLIMAPKFSKGTLVTWSEGLTGIAVVEHNSDAHIHVKELYNKDIDKLCHLYMYGYVEIHGEEAKCPIQISRRTRPTTMDQMEDDPMSTSSPMNESIKEEGKNKRKDPETRTVVLAPEKKRQRMELHNLFMKSIWWMMQRSRRIQLPLHEIWYEDELRWMRRSQPGQTQPTAPPRILLHLHCRTEAHLNIYLTTGEIYRVDEDTDVLDEQQVLENWPHFEESDRLEIKQFIDEKVFKKVKISELPEEVALVDAVWVRKYKRTADKSLKAKSRLCARGFLDPQKRELPTRSTTATRLSQRLVLSMAACHRFDIRSWDVSGAFLKGFSFAKVREVLRRKGVATPNRRVVIIPPPNVWRHLGSFDESFHITDDEQGMWGLECLKPAYGLVDAPLAWQLCLHDALETSGGSQSSLDENLWLWKSPNGLTALMTTHVDDLAVTGTDDFLENQYKFLCGRFGKISIQKLPFAHCGCRYSRTGDGYAMDQQEFIDNMKVLDLGHLGSDQSRSLEPSETTLLRSILGGLLWITATRLDLVADVGVLQSRVTKATVQDLHMANSIVRKAKLAQYNGIGITYKCIPKDVAWRLVASS